MGAPYIDEMADYWKEHPKALLYEVAEALGVPFSSLARSFDNGLSKNYWQIKLTPDTPAKEETVEPTHEIVEVSPKQFSRIQMLVSNCVGTDGRWHEGKWLAGLGEIFDRKLFVLGRTYALKVVYGRKES